MMRHYRLAFRLRLDKFLDKHELTVGCCFSILLGAVIAGGVLFVGVVIVAFVEQSIK